MLLLALFTAFILRFWRLDLIPPGFYRDEAFNGLDALRVLRGEYQLFFPANNGREPLYIYLTALAISLFGQTVAAVRITAALVGTLTTLPVYMLGKSWFGWPVGILSGWLWAITLWPVHLSRLGLRIILLAPLLTLTFWLGTAAYRRQKNWIWMLAGLLYGLTFYTYLASRITPVLLVILGLFLLWKKQGDRLWPGSAWFLIGGLIAVSPLLYLTWQQPDWLAGRTSQVSIFHPDVNGGDFWGTLSGNILAAAGMFIFRGDSILRHNPGGRPIFDILMVIPFLIGLFWCLISWRKPGALVLLTWTGLMLLPTVLAADAPHFLRAAGVLPAIIFLPAIGLYQIGQWKRVPQAGAWLLVALLILGSLTLTIIDYRAYGDNPQVGYYFESAAVDLARQLNEDPPGTAQYLDERFWSNWPSLSFLVIEDDRVFRYLASDDLPDHIEGPAVIYAWPYESLEFIPEVLVNSPMMLVDEGGLARGDLDDTPYPLFIRYESKSLSEDFDSNLAHFDDQLTLSKVDVDILNENKLQIDIYWQAEKPIDEDLVVFVHVQGNDELMGQDDSPLAGGRWPNAWWRQGLLVRDRHQLTLNEPFDSSRHQIVIGLYAAETGRRLPVIDANTGMESGNSWIIGAE